jgi:hypothetical protein
MTTPPNLDALLTLQECADWLRMHPRDLSARSRGRNPRIPAIRFNRQVIRYHPRTILAKLAAESGVRTELIAASLNPNTPEKK